MMHAMSRLNILQLVESKVSAAERFAIIFGLFLASCLGTYAAGDGYSITIDASIEKGIVSPLLFGQNIEWRWGQSLMKDPTRPGEGFRDDILVLARNLRVQALRYPGGNGSDMYHWRDAVGPISQRQPQPDYYRKMWTPYFGTDEFVDFCRQISCNYKVITVNFCTGTPREAANWVEYCNAPAPRKPDRAWTPHSYGGSDVAPKGYFAWLRAFYGHSKPYGIQYWEIGNEVYTRIDLYYEITAADYAERAIEYIQAMKSVDSTIKIGLNVADYSPWMDWNDVVLSRAGSAADFVLPHYYSSLSSLLTDIFYRGSEAVREAYFPVSETYTFSVVARASLMKSGPPDEEVGIPATMELRIDGNAVHAWQVGEVLARYEVSYPISAGTHTISVAFTNDIWNPETDDGRDLYVYSATRRSASVPEESILYPDGWEEQFLLRDFQSTSTRLRNLRTTLQTYSPEKTLVIAITEGGMSYPYEGSVRFGYYPEEDVRHCLRYKSAFWEAMFLNTLINEQIPIYCHWNLLDPGNSGLIRDPAYTAMGLPTVTPTYYAMQMYSRLAGAKVLGIDLRSASFDWPPGIPVPIVADGTDYSTSHLRPEGVLHLDTIACRSASNRLLYLIVANRYHKPARAAIRISGYPVRPSTLVGVLSVQDLKPRTDRIIGNAHSELEAHMETMTLGQNVVNPDVVGITWSNLSNASENFEYEFPAYSITFMELQKR